MDTTANTPKYYLKLGDDTSRIKAGEKFTFSFIPKLKKDENSPVILDEIHERKAHLIFVSEDLEYFNHIHPEVEQNGKYSVETSLPFGGKYILFIEYKPRGNEKITELINITVAGKQKPDKIYTLESYTYKGKEYSVELSNNEKVIANLDSRIFVSIYKDKNEITENQLENYLGEKAHAVAISLNDRNFLHVHPMVMGNKLNLHINFGKPGFYRLWVQFKKDEQLYTSDFVLKAIQADKNEIKANQHNHH